MQKPLAAQPFTLDFSVGNGGVSGSLSGRGVADGSLWFSLGEVFCVHGKTGIGFSFSPFRLEGLFSDADRWASGDLSVRFINCSIFHKTLPIYSESFLGPYIELHWLGLDSLEPEVIAGLRLDLRDYSPRLFGKAEEHRKPSLLFRLLTLDAGVRYREGEFAAYLALSTDALIVLPIVGASLRDDSKLREAQDAADPYRKDGPLPEENPADRKAVAR